MNEAEALRRLDARTNYERDGRLVAPSLGRMAALMERLDHPQRTAPVIHVTGTNGKTTCAWAATEVLRAMGLVVGTYISPHLKIVRERIAYDTVLISAQEFAETYAYLEPFMAEVDRGDQRITWFEAVTAMAFVWFADKAVDAQVIEVGMGGAWDATNVADGRVAVVTEVALDHPELGATTVDIAGEKAGIVKPGAIALTAERDDDVFAVLEPRARERGAELRRMGESFDIESREVGLGGQQVDLRLGGRLYRGLFLPLLGERMASDVALGATAAWSFLGERDLEEDLLAEAFAKIRAPGRVEVLRRRPLLVLDGAHNPAAAAALAAAMRESFRWDRLILVLGMLANKDAAGVIEALAPIVDDVFVAPVASPRSLPPELLEREAQAQDLRTRRVATVAGAVAAALEAAGESDCVLVSGSLYTVGEAKAALEEMT